MRLPFVCGSAGQSRSTATTTRGSTTAARVFVALFPFLRALMHCTTTAMCAPVTSASVVLSATIATSPLCSVVVSGRGVFVCVFMLVLALFIVFTILIWFLMVRDLRSASCSSSAVSPSIIVRVWNSSNESSGSSSYTVLSSFCFTASFNHDLSFNSSSQLFLRWLMKFVKRILQISWQ